MKMYNQLQLAHGDLRTDSHPCVRIQCTCKVSNLLYIFIETSRILPHGSKNDVICDVTCIHKSHSILTTVYTTTSWSIILSHNNHAINYNSKNADAETCGIGRLHVMSQMTSFLLPCGKILLVSMKMYSKFYTLHVHWTRTQGRESILRSPWAIAAAGCTFSLRQADFAART